MVRQAFLQPTPGRALRASTTHIRSRCASPHGRRLHRRETTNRLRQRARQHLLASWRIMIIRGAAMWGITRAAMSANGGSISLRLSSERRKLRGLARARGHWAFPGILSMRRSTFAKFCRIRLPLVQSVPSDCASGEGESDVTMPARRREAPRGYDATCALDD